MKPAARDEYVLIAESDPRLAAVYAELIGRAGFATEVHRDGESARAALTRRGAPVLLVADVSLPRLDGFELVRALRRIASTERSPAVMTASSMALRTAAWNLKSQLGIVELLATSMSVDTIQHAFTRALARRDMTPPPGAPPPAPPAAEPLEPAPPKHADKARQARIEATGILDEPVGAPPADRELQSLVEQTAKRFGVPIALVSVVLEDRQWFKAHVGLAGRLLAQRGTPIEEAFCRHVVDADEPGPLVVPDARHHPAFADNALVRDGSVVSYAGAPLVTGDGDVLGTLCIIDSKPSAISAEQVDALVAIARRVAGVLELRAQTRRDALDAQALRRSLATSQAHLRATRSVLGNLEAVLSCLETGVVVYDERKVVLYANAAIGVIAGVAPADLVGRPRAELVETLASMATDGETVRRVMRAPDDDGPFAAREHFELARPARRVLRWVARPLTLGERVAQLALFTDVTAETLAHEAHERLALADPVTGLANRRAGEEALLREFARARRHGRTVSFAMIDVDRFKSVNDAHGHLVGDRVLAGVAKAIASAVRTSDIAARWGGDEFAVVLPETTLEGARTTLERARFAVAALALPDTPRVTISCGVATFAPEDTTADALIARADAALYEAKRAGRDAVR